MDRDIPSFNRTVMQRIYQKNHQLHLKRLKNIKSGISSTKSHNKPNHLTNSTSLIGPNYHSRLPQYHNLKRQSQQEMNNTKIQRQNALLFKKMIKIMKRPDKNNDPSAPRYNLTMSAAKQRMSMEFSKINEENRTLFHRLQQQKPTIDMKKLQEERLKNLNILKFLGKYPNQQAMSRVKQQQYNTFDMRSKRMSSTLNRIYYNNLHNSNNHLQEYQEGQQNYFDEGQYSEENYEKFRNEMQFYDREINQLKHQTIKAANKNNRTIQKFASTSNNYYSNRQNYQEQFANKQIRLNNQNHYANQDHHLNHGIDEPTLPGRRRFLSQGGNRHMSYNNDERVNFPQIHQVSYHQDEQNVDDHDEQQQDQSYPYHLNSPSNNIVIQNRLNSYYNNRNQNKKTKLIQNTKQQRSMMGVTQKPGTLIKPNIPKPNTISNHQRKLNTKHSKSNLTTLIQPLPQEIEPSVRPQQFNNMFQNEFYHESMRQQDEQYETEPSPNRVIQRQYHHQTHNNSKKNIQQQNNSKRNSQKISLNQNMNKNKNYQQQSTRQDRNYSHSQNRTNYSQDRPTYSNDRANYSNERTNLNQNATSSYNPKTLTSGQIQQIKNKLISQKTILLYKKSISLSELVVETQREQLASDIGGINHNSNIVSQFQQRQICSALQKVLLQYSASIQIHRLSDCYKVSVSTVTQSHNINNNNKKKRHPQHQQPSKHQPSQQNHLTKINPSLITLVKSYIQRHLKNIVEVQIPQEQGSLLLEQIDYNYNFFITQMVKIEKDAEINEKNSNQTFYRLVVVLNDQENNQEAQGNQQTQENIEAEVNSKKQHLNQNDQQQRTSQQPLPPIEQPTNQNNTLLKSTNQVNSKDIDQQPTLTKPQAFSSNISQQKNLHPQPPHQNSTYVEALDQQLL